MTENLVIELLSGHGAFKSNSPDPLDNCPTYSDWKDILWSPFHLALPKSIPETGLFLTFYGSPSQTWKMFDASKLGRCFGMK